VKEQEMTSSGNVTVVRGGTIWSGVPGQAPVAADLVIEDGVIATIEPGFTGAADTELDATSALVLPGLFNSHLHPGGSPLIRGIAEDMELPPNGAFFHNTAAVLGLGRAELSLAEYQSLIEWDCVAMLAGGATTLTVELLGTGYEQIWIDLVERLGFRCNLGLTYPHNIIKPTPDEVTAGLRDGVALVDEHNGAFGDRLRVQLSPHGPDTVTDEVLRETRRIASERGLNVHLHLAQHMGEVKTVQGRSGGLGPVAYLEKMGFLGPDVVATHGTYIESGDVARLAASGATIVYCGYRKAKEALTTPFTEYLEGGVNVVLGTDTFSHNMIEDMKFGAILGKIRHGSVSRPTALDMVTCATVNAARAMRREDLGRLAPGCRGDVTVIGLTGPFNTPAIAPIKNLVYYSTASDIRHTLVDGRPVVRGGQVGNVDLADVRRRATAAVTRLWDLAQDKGVLTPAW
jgi:5-methylthioadenosine/S-adenosylhomocysteine deaminase